MRHIRYMLVLTISVVLLTGAALTAYGKIGAASLRHEDPPVVAWPGDSAPPPPPGSLPTIRDYEKYAAADAEWRRQNARHYTLAQIRALGDGTRSPRQLLDDRVYLFVKRGETDRAMGALEAWIERNPRDENAILWLARMLRESGRTDEAVALYRRLISIDERRGQ